MPRPRGRGVASLALTQPHHHPHPERVLMSKSKAEFEYFRSRSHQVRNRKKTLRQYGVTPGDVEGMESRQRGPCAVCWQPPREGRRLHVDHDHATGRVRSSLCGDCIRGLLARNDPASGRNARCEIAKRLHKRPDNRSRGDERLNLAPQVRLGAASRPRSQR